MEEPQTSEPMQAVAALVSALLQQAEREPALRQALRSVAEWVLATLNEAPPAAERAVTAQPPAAPKQVVSLRLGGAAVPVRVSGTPAEVHAARGAAPVAVAAEPRAAEPLPDLRLVAQRARLKAESCRWAITRRRRLAERADFDTLIKPTDVTILARARALPNCYVWPLDPYANLPSDAELDMAAACYENLAAAAELTEEIRQALPEDDAFREESYVLLAEAQSAVRAVMAPLSSRPDQDQNDAFLWLRRRTFEDQVLIPRYMRRDDVADPSASNLVAQRLTELRLRYEGLRQMTRQRQQLLNKARFHARKVADAAGADALDDWQALISAAEGLVNEGVPPSDTELRELLLPILDAMPPDVPYGGAFERVLAEIDRYIASREPERPETMPAAATSPAVTRVADLLRGRVVVMIGGERRPHAQAALERDFELRELRWVATRPHQSIADFESHVARPETALVLLAIRWASHSFEGVADMCARYGKPFVRLPAGYGSNQVAVQILDQASAELARLGPAEA